MHWDDQQHTKRQTRQVEGSRRKKLKTNFLLNSLHASFNHFIKLIWFIFLVKSRPGLNRGEMTSRGLGGCVCSAEKRSKAIMNMWKVLFSNLKNRFGCELYGLFTRKTHCCASFFFCCRISAHVMCFVTRKNLKSEKKGEREISEISDPSNYWNATMRSSTFAHVLFLFALELDFYFHFISLPVFSLTVYMFITNSTI